MAAWARGAPAPDLPGVAVTGRGAFVTLRRGGALRGCIGRLISDGPLDELVRDMAIAAARDDPRFPPLAADELDGLEVEVSVLSRPAPIRAEAVEPGRHGLIVTRGAHQGVLLPQVAREYGWDRETFLAMTCRKAGLAPDAWRQAGTRLDAFEAEVIGDRSA